MAKQKRKAENDTIEPAGTTEVNPLVRKHLLIGWIGLLVFLALGLVLESLHGLKIPFYLDVRNETRRLMWTLAHAHGTLFSLIHIAFAVTVSTLALPMSRTLKMASGALTGSLIAMPLGFFLGGVWLYGGDPGMGIVLAPIGGMMIVVAVWFTISVIRNSDA